MISRTTINLFIRTFIVMLVVLIVAICSFQDMNIVENDMFLVSGICEEAYLGVGISEGNSLFMDDGKEYFFNHIFLEYLDCDFSQLEGEQIRFWAYESKTIFGSADFLIVAWGDGDIKNESFEDYSNDRIISYIVVLVVLCISALLFIILPQLLRVIEERYQKNIIIWRKERKEKEKARRQKSFAVVGARKPFENTSKKKLKRIKKNS